MDYLIGEEEFLGKGLGRELVGLLVSEVFARPDAERIIVQPDSENRASCNALLANGFHFDAKNSFYCRSSQG